MSEQTCKHMTEARPSGACYICQPSMFRLTPAEVDELNLALEARQGNRLAARWDAHGATQQREPEPAMTAAAPPPDLAPWQELTTYELAILDTLVTLADDAAFEGLTLDDVFEVFVHAGELGIPAWSEQQVRDALTGLQRRGYAGPYDTGEWAASGKGIAVIEDYRRRNEYRAKVG